MNRAAKIAAVIFVALVAAAGGYYLSVQRAFHSMGSELPHTITFLAERFEAAAKPLREADVFARYNSSAQTFTIRRPAAPDTAAELSEPQFVEFIRSSGVTTPKVLIFYPAADFPNPSERTAFESRLRSVLASAGASSVTFGAQSPAKSLYE